MKTNFKAITATAFAKDSNTRIEALGTITANIDENERSYRHLYIAGYRVGHSVSPDSKDKVSLLSVKAYQLLLKDVATALCWAQADRFLVDSTMAEYCKANDYTKAEYKDQLLHKRRAYLTSQRKNVLQKMRDGLDRAEKALNMPAYERRKKAESKKAPSKFDMVKISDRISKLIDLIETAGDDIDVASINKPLITAYNLIQEQIAKH